MTEDGIFAAGSALGMKDIVDSIAEASAAAMQAANYIRAAKAGKIGLSVVATANKGSGGVIS
jgi:heterodisulfide reductase subunit A-like polyferredoxin